jgi:ADP-heptose:LPS heptosyltransferase
VNLPLLKKADYWLGSLLAAVLSPVAFVLGKILRRDRSPELRGQLVVVKILGGGSLLIALPALLGLRERYPDRRFTLLCSPQVRKFAELTGVFDDYATIETGGLIPFAVSCFKALKSIFRADAVINFEIHSRLTGVFCLLSGARNRIGLWMNWNRWQSALITHALFYNDSGPIYAAYNQAAAILGAAVPGMTQAAARFRAFNGLPDRDPAAGGDPAAPVVALAPYCSDLAPEREFADDAWVKLIAGRYPAAKGPAAKGEVLLFGGPADTARAERTAATLSAGLPGWTVRNLAGRSSLAQSMARLATADELLTIDSGLNHIARLLRVPTVSYWGPTDPHRRLAPFDDGAPETVIYRPVFCSPCVHLMDVAPCGGDNICMRQHLGDIDTDRPARGWLLRGGDDGKSEQGR